MPVYIPVIQNFGIFNRSGLYQEPDDQASRVGGDLAAAPKHALRRSLPQQVAELVHGRIIDGTYPPGSKLPHQRVLAEHLDVSPTVIRESLALLVSSGLIRTRSGQGTFVVDVPDTALRFPVWVRDPRSSEELDDAIEAREILEQNVVALAVERRTAADIKALRAIVELMSEHAGDPERFAETDLAFHLTLARAARNRVFAGTLAGIRRLIGQELVLRATRAIDEGTMDRAIEAHRALVDAIESRDADTALAEIRGCLDRAHEAASSRRRRTSRRSAGGPVR